MPAPALSVLDLIPFVEGGSSTAALQSATGLARAVDRLGYTRLWYAEHHNMPGIATTTPEILIAHVAPQTTYIRLGAGGVMLPNHSSLKVAESYKLLEALHPGRIDLGIGRAPGTDGRTALALRRSRQGIGAEDFVDQLAELMAWGGGTFPGDHPFRTVRAMPDDRPLPEIWLLGSSDYGATLAAQLGLGFAFAGHFSQDPPVVPMRSYRAAFTPSARRATPHAILALSVFCADTDQAAQHMASSMRLSFVQLRAGRPGRLPHPDVAMAHPYSADERPVVDFFTNLQICGTPEQVRSRLEDAAARTEADEIMVVTHAFDPEARLRSYQLVAEAFGLKRPDAS